MHRSLFECERTQPLDYLNIGCGNRISPGWINLDRVSGAPEVRRWDVTRGLPFADGSFDVVYASHLLEHLKRAEAMRLLYDCRRVLRVGGIARIVVPDFEQQVRIYLRALDGARGGDEKSVHDYDWMMLEILDQLVRHQPGGDLSLYLQRADIPNEQFVYSRIGAEARRIISAGRTSQTKPRRHVPLQSTWTSSARRHLSRFVQRTRELGLRLLLGQDYQSLKIGRFRLSGEAHLWMYDSYALTRLLQTTGFTDTAIFSATESQIPNWSTYCLDTEPNGVVYKPDSLYVEGVRR